MPGNVAARPAALRAIVEHWRGTIGPEDGFSDNEPATEVRAFARTLAAQTRVGRPRRRRRRHEGDAYSETAFCVPYSIEEHVMPTQNINLSSREFSLIERLVESGRYRNASQVLKEGLRLIETKEAHERGGRPLKPLGDTVSAGGESVDLRALILEAKAARERMMPLEPGDILAWRDEGRA